MLKEKINKESFDALHEVEQKHYELIGEEYILQGDFKRQDDVDNLNKALKAAREERDTVKAELGKWKGSGVSLEDALERIQSHRPLQVELEQLKAKVSGTDADVENTIQERVEARMEAQGNKHNYEMSTRDAKIKELEGQLTDLNTRFQGRTVEDKISQELARVGVRPCTM